MKIGLYKVDLKALNIIHHLLLHSASSMLHTTMSAKKCLAAFVALLASTTQLVQGRLTQEQTNG